MWHIKKILKVITGIAIIIFSILCFPTLKHVVTMEELNNRILSAANDYLKQCSIQSKVEQVDLETETLLPIRLGENPNIWYASVADPSIHLSGELTDKFISIDRLNECPNPYIMKLQSRDKVFKYTEKTSPKSLEFNSNFHNRGRPLEFAIFVYLENLFKIMIYLFFVGISLFMWRFLFKDKQDSSPMP